MSNANPFAPRFETQTCNRCKGSGHFSSSAMHGTKCYGCNGGGKQLTKRGKAARDFMRSRLIKAAAEVVVGDVVWFNMGTFKVSTSVLRIESGGVSRLEFHGTRKKTGEAIVAHLVFASQVEMAYTCQELEAIRDEVEAYQSTLTKAGSVAKRLRQAA